MCSINIRESYPVLMFNSICWIQEFIIDSDSIYMKIAFA